MAKLRALEPQLYSLKQIKEMCGQECREAASDVVKMITTNIEPPFSIALDGPWGAGKTTFMLLVKSLLEEQKYPTVWFNPWEYDYADDVVLAMQKHIASEFKDRFGIGVKELGVFALTLATVGISTFAKKLAGVDYGDLKELGDDAKVALGEAHYVSYDDPVQAFKVDFIRLTHKVTSKEEYRNKPLILFLDDLDRCLPENALKLLEAMKNQFIVRTDKDGAAKVIAFSAVDTGVAKRFISKRYENIGSDFAANYFKKIFNLTLPLPPALWHNAGSYLRNHISALIPPGAGVSPSSLTAELLDMNAMAGGKSIRLLLNVANNCLLYLPGRDNGPDFQVVLGFLFLREFWNEFHEELGRRLAKFKAAPFATALQSSGMDTRVNEDPRLAAFMNAKILRHSVGTETLFDSGLL